MRLLRGRSLDSKPVCLFYFIVLTGRWGFSYGEQDSIIIHQTLYLLFPPDDMPLTSVDPLTLDQFITRVLVPETAVLLIQTDISLSTKAEALRVLDDSKKYGLAMFPEQAQGERQPKLARGGKQTQM